MGGLNVTNIEMDVARSTIRTNKAVADHLQVIDWEQRRYEIAKDYAIGLMTADWFEGEIEDACYCGVKLADKLIEELKKPQTQK